jgi:translation initiation factor IF-3
MFRGREMTHPERGRDLLLRLAEDVKELGAIESQPLQDGRNMVMMLAPHRAVVAPAAKPEDGEPAEAADATAAPGEAAAPAEAAPAEAAEVEVAEPPAEAPAEPADEAATGA